MFFDYLILKLLVIFNIKSIMADYNAIDLSYILNDDYMPGSLLVLENPEYNEKSVVNNNTDLSEYYGTFDEALNTMDYHRKMMNEYLCRSYLSQQIITEMKSNRIKRRLGSPANKRDNMPSKINFSMRSNLLEDEGSSKYQNWLKNSATLQDIYRHYDKTAQNREYNVESGKDGNQGSEEFEGQITGFGYQQSSSANSPAKLGNSASGSGYSYPGYQAGNIYSGSGGTGGGGGGGLYNGHSSYGGGGGGGFNNHAEHIIIAETTGGQSGHGYGGHDHSPKHQGGSKEKLADLFEIALTALAFLSFGMFIIQVIMCICMTTTTTAPAVTMMAMSMNPTGTGMNEMNMGAGEAAGEGGGAEGGGEGDADTGTSGRGDSELADDITEIDEGNIGETYNNGDGEYKIVLTYDNNGNTADGISNGGYSRSIGDDSAGTGGSGTGTGTGTGADEDGSADDSKRKIRYKSKRDIPTITQPNNEALNELARRILISIEAALIAHQDDGNCLRNSLCENNLYSRNLGDDQRYWVPVWSLGMSWLSGKLIRGGSRSSIMLDTLKSSLLGLGNADCELLYNKCELQKERQKRLKRKR